MAPTRKSRSAVVNKHAERRIDVSPSKDKTNNMKRKLTDMLGSEWSKEEIERFYEAYRKYGKEWKKVASAVRYRSKEMVEALYNMNRAYLSLPEGTASVVGLIAMMTDHYAILEGRDNERNSNGESNITNKLPKRARPKARVSIVRESTLHSQPATSNDGCLSFLNKGRLDGHAVGKRTPRFPILYPSKKEGKELDHYSKRKDQKLQLGANAKDVAHVAALALTEASHSERSSMVSESLFNSQRDMWNSVANGPAMVKDRQGGPGGQNAEVSDRDSILLASMEGVGTVDVRKGKKYHAKKDKISGNVHYDGSREACSGNDGADVNSGSRLIDVTDVNVSSPQSRNKRSKKILFGGESSVFDALQTLADLSLMMPAFTVEPESSEPVKEEKFTLDMTGNSSFAEVLSSGQQTELSGSKDYKHPSLSALQVSSTGKLVLQQGFTSLESKFLPLVNDKAWTRKRKSLSIKAPGKEEDKSLHKYVHSKDISASRAQLKLLEPADKSLNDEHEKTRIDAELLTVQAATTKRNHRKMNPHRMSINKELSTQKIIKQQLTKYSASARDKNLCHKEALSTCLSSYMVRRWCAFEWFYSAIDYPWFAKKEFVDYLDHVGLCHVPRLTRVEWGVIRSSLGKPRRFSQTFLNEEREKLKQYRESVRNHYSELRAGVREGVPKDLSRPLTVGQRVITFHPKRREFYDGSILTVDHSKFRVQFDLRDVGVQFVKDIDCMPFNPSENMPEALKKKQLSVSEFYAEVEDPEVNTQSNLGRPLIFDSIKHPKTALCYPQLSLTHQINPVMSHTKVMVAAQSKSAPTDLVSQKRVAHSQSDVVSQINAREADMLAVSELNHAIDKKVAPSRDVKHTNNYMMDQRVGDKTLKDSEPFRKRYTMVSSASNNLKQQNSYYGNHEPSFMKLQAFPSDPVIFPKFVHDTKTSPLESSSNVLEVLNSSKRKARLMVNIAKQALSSAKEGEDAFLRIGEAFNSMNKYQLASKSEMSSTDLVNGSLLDPSAVDHESDLQLNRFAVQTEAQILSDLIASCVAALLTIQMCTERQYPPADVAEILESAVTGLNPRCYENLHIYRDIQVCVGRIKTQILSRVPS